MTVPDQTLASVIAGVQDLDPDVTVFDHPRARTMENGPHLLPGGVDVEAEAMFLHDEDRSADERARPVPWLPHTREL